MSFLDCTKKYSELHWYSLVLQELCLKDIQLGTCPAKFFILKQFLLNQQSPYM